MLQLTIVHFNQNFNTCLHTSQTDTTHVQQKSELKCVYLKLGMYWYYSLSVSNNGKNLTFRNFQFQEPFFWPAVQSL